MSAMTRLLKVCSVIVVVALLDASSINADNTSSVAETVSSPVFPFGENGLCSQNCPSLGLGAVVDFLSISVLGQNSTGRPRASLNAGDTIAILFVGLDNGGYSNWWDVKATLVSDINGSRAPLGKGERDDGNDFKSIKVSCDRYFNKCNPNTTWSMLKIPASFPTGSYSVELEFTPFATSALPVVTHLFGPGVLTVNGAAAAPGASAQSKGLNGRPCVNLGRIRVDQGVQYACIKSGSKKIWRKIA
jgi:hypothetical protein